MFARSRTVPVRPLEWISTRTGRSLRSNGLTADDSIESKNLTNYVEMCRSAGNAQGNQQNVRIGSKPLPAVDIQVNCIDIAAHAAFILLRPRTMPAFSET